MELLNSFFICSAYSLLLFKSVSSYAKANDVTILEDVEKEQINKLYSEEEIEKAYEQAI